MLGPTKGRFFYKFKSEKKFKELTHDLPALVSHIRLKLREIFGINEDMEILVTPSNKNGGVSNTYLSDYELIKDGMYLNVIRLPKDLAKPLCEAANSRIKNSKFATPTSNATTVSDNSGSNAGTNHLTTDTTPTTSASPNTTSSTANRSLHDAHNPNPLPPSSAPMHSPSSWGKSTNRIATEHTTKPTTGSVPIDSVEDAAILSVMQQHGEKFKQTTAQRNEMLEQLNARGCPKSTSHNTPITGTGAQFRADPYRRPNNQAGAGPLAPGQGGNGPIYKGNVSASASTEVPADYICHMCGERGHHIRVCPKVNEGSSQKKIRPATGIPRSFLRAINFDEEGRLYSEVYCLPDGTFAVLKDAKQLSSTAFLTRTVEDTIGKHMGKSKEDTGLVRNSLTCPICKRLFRYAVLTPCCGETYCRECVMNYIRNHIDANSGVSPNTIKGHCPHCSTVVSITDLEPNNPIRKSVNVALGLQQS